MLPEYFTFDADLHREKKQEGWDSRISDTFISLLLENKTFRGHRGT